MAIAGGKIGRRVRIRPFFRWYDLYIGAYVDREAGAVYVLFLPMLGLRISVEKYLLCSVCGKRLSQYAHDTGDGWYLFWDCALGCDDGGDLIVAWPFRGDSRSAGELVEAGYRLV